METIENLIAAAQVFATLSIAYTGMSQTCSPNSPKRELLEKKAEYAATKAVLVLEKSDIWSVDALK